MVSNTVGTIQKTLNSLGFPCGVADNIFGTGTMKAVQDFQKSKGLIPDGEVGPETLRNLNL
jgi:peptidoglycan hydrolase-like protein with peptidoglycan-binding domain